MVAVWKSDMVGSDIDPLHGVFRGARRQPWLGALVSAEPSTAPHHPIAPRDTSPVTDPKRTAKPDQRHRQGKREIIGLMAVAVTVAAHPAGFSSNNRARHTGTLGTPISPIAPETFGEHRWKHKFKPL